MSGKNPFALHLKFVEDEQIPGVGEQAVPYVWQYGVADGHISDFSGSGSPTQV